MTERYAIELGSVQITLLLPLWGRAKESRRKHPKIVDRKACDIIGKIDYDFSRIAEKIKYISQLEWIARSIHIDRSIRKFLSRHPRATIVNVGCGLDTTFDRVDNGQLVWFDLDLPDVIDLRRKFIPEIGRRTYISASFLDDCWFRRIHPSEHILFIAAGVLYYFEEEQIKQIFNKISSAFPGSEFIFDAASPFGVKLANRKIIRSIGLGEQSCLKWGLDRAADILAWNSTIRVVEEYPVYKGMKGGLSLKNRYLAFISDRHRIMFMVHLKM
jgi:O-methyltransferase involved in polyketide biosynthesis